jgi:prepilin-type N-terminal cleavage/methylation domain-containing protein
MQTSKPSAFTLIELLIVVAIIAILATLGLVNFMEAQARSKVSRAKSDMRSFSTALESYAVDHNAYVDTFGLVKLTTPVAYISTITRDVFAAHDGSPYLGYMNAIQESDANELANWQVTNSTDAQRASLAGHAWIAWSNGPDMVDTALKDTQKSFNDVVNAPGADAGLFYDSTNGTASRGDVLRSPRLNK